MLTWTAAEGLSPPSHHIMLLPRSMDQAANAPRRSALRPPTQSTCKSTVSQISQHPCQSHFPFPGLEAVIHRGLSLSLGLRAAYGIAEEIGIATELLGRRQGDRVDAILDYHATGRREAGDAMRERSNEFGECCSGQRPIDPAVSFRQLGVIVLRAQQDLERPG